MEIKLTKEVKTVEQITIDLPEYFVATPYLFDYSYHCHIIDASTIEVVGIDEDIVNVHTGATMVNYYTQRGITESTKQEFTTALATVIANRWGL